MLGYIVDNDRVLTIIIQQHHIQDYVQQEANQLRASFGENICMPPNPCHKHGPEIFIFKSSNIRRNTFNARFTASAYTSIGLFLFFRSNQAAQDKMAWWK